MEITLAEKIKKNLSIIKVKGAVVKVPKLRIKKIKTIKSKPKKQNDKIPNSSIINILIKIAVAKAKREVKEKSVEKDKSYKLITEGNKLIAHGGYGAVSKSYGSVHTSYIDYGKLFSYLGSFRAKQPYENMAEHIGVLNKSIESGSFTLVDIETMDKGARQIKYFMPLGTNANIHTPSLFPMPGMSSGEWEQFKLWMKLDPVIYALKKSI